MWPTPGTSIGQVRISEHQVCVRLREHPAGADIAAEEQGRASHALPHRPLFVPVQPGSFQGWDEHRRVHVPQAAGDEPQRTPVPQGGQRDPPAGERYRRLTEFAGHIRDRPVRPREPPHGRERGVVGRLRQPPEERGRRRVFEDDRQDQFGPGGRRAGRDQGPERVPEKDRRPAQPVEDCERVFDVVGDLIPVRGPAGPAVPAVIDEVEMPARGEGGDNGKEVRPPSTDPVEQDERRAVWRADVEPQDTGPAARSISTNKAALEEGGDPTTRASRSQSVGRSPRFRSTVAAGRVGVDGFDLDGNLGLHRRTGVGEAPLAGPSEGFAWSTTSEPPCPRVNPSAETRRIPRLPALPCPRPVVRPVATGTAASRTGRPPPAVRL